jgi:hypothetical protein
MGFHTEVEVINININISKSISNQFLWNKLQLCKLIAMEKMETIDKNSEQSNLSNQLFPSVLMEYSSDYIHLFNSSSTGSETMPNYQENIENESISNIINTIRIHSNQPVVVKIIKQLNINTSNAIIKTYCAQRRNDNIKKMKLVHSTPLTTTVQLDGITKRS